MSAERRRLLARCAAFFAAACAVGCAGQSRNAVAQEEGAPSGCRVRLIVGLDRAPDDALVADLARTSGARLDVLSAIDSVRLYVFSLSADGPPAECDAATERLRRDPSVRSVDVDARRELRPE